MIFVVVVDFLDFLSGFKRVAPLYMHWNPCIGITVDL